MAPTAPTVSSFMRQKQTVPSVMMRKVTHRVNQLQEELALESVTNIEFEESSRRSFDFLIAQVNTLKAAFNNMTDTFLQELDHLSGAFGNEVQRLDEICVKDKANAQRLEKRIDHINGELDSVLNVVPKIEESMLRSSQHFQERLEQTSSRLQDRLDQASSSLADRLEQTSLNLQKGILMMQNLEERVNRTEEALREELEQKCLQLQRNFTRQFEGLNRIMTSDALRGDSRGKQSPSLNGGWGGSFSSPNRRDSPRERARPEKSDRSPSAGNSPVTVGGRENLLHGSGEFGSRIGLAEASPAKFSSRSLDFESPFKGKYDSR